MIVFYFIIVVGSLIGGAIEYLHAEQWLQHVFNREDSKKIE